MFTVLDRQEAAVAAANFVFRRNFLMKSHPA
jgi:hypothetical protein